MANRRSKQTHRVNRGLSFHPGNVFRQRYLARYTELDQREMILNSGCDYRLLICSVLSIAIDLMGLDLIEIGQLCDERRRRGFGRVELKRVLGELPTVETLVLRHVLECS
jgi:hypothetical protein